MSTKRKKKLSAVQKRERALRIEINRSEREAEAVRRTAIDAVARAVPAGIGTKLIAIPAIDVLGAGELSVVGIEYDPTEPVFRVSGTFTVAALKQLLAGTVFRLKLEPKKPA